MQKLLNKDQVKSELEKAGIKICVSSCVGPNSFHHVHECYGHFTVNAADSTSIETSRSFTKTWTNITILINT